MTRSNKAQRRKKIAGIVALLLVLIMILSTIAPFLSYIAMS